MKDETDTKTVEIFPAPTKRRGRPVTGNAKSDAERAREYRLRKKTEPAKPDFRDEEMRALREYAQHLQQDLNFAKREIAEQVIGLRALNDENTRLYNALQAYQA